MLIFNYLLSAFEFPIYLGSEYFAVYYLILT